MKLGVTLPFTDAAATTSELKTFIRTVETAGLDSIWLGDHIVLPARIDPANYPYRWRFTDEQLADPAMQDLFPNKYFLEALVTCGYLAGVSDRMSVGIGVVVVPMRNPVQLAAQLATVDVLCGGRSIVGVGAGWAREEFRALGREDAYAARGAVLDESIAAMRALWGEQPARFEGDHVRFDPVHCEPTPLQSGGPPIWIGGDSKRALRRVVELGSGWQPIELPPDRFAETSRTLDELLERAGRNPTDVERSVSTRLPLSDPSDGRARNIIEQYRDAGCDHLVLFSGSRNSIAENQDRALLFHELAAESTDTGPQS